MISIEKSKRLDSDDVADLVGTHLLTIAGDSPYMNSARGSILSWLLDDEVNELVKLTNAKARPDTYNPDVFNIECALAWGVEFGLAAAFAATNSPPQEALDQISRLVRTVKLKYEERIECTKRLKEAPQKPARRHRGKAAA